jgi:hypothetical protein
MKVAKAALPLQLGAFIPTQQSEPVVADKFDALPVKFLEAGASSVAVGVYPAPAARDRHLGLKRGLLSPSPWEAGGRHLSLEGKAADRWTCHRTPVPNGIRS